MGYSLGVDLGTGYTAAAVSRDGRVDAISLGDRADYVPSVIYRSPQGEFSFGEPAERHAAAEPERMAREFKQWIGLTPDASEQARTDGKTILGDSSMTAEELSRALLGWVLEQVVTGQGEPPGRLTISYPAPWKPFQRKSMRDVAPLPGEFGVGFCTEPEAAAVHYASSRPIPADGTVAVYDLGTGTLDVAVLQRTAGGRFEVLGQPVGLPDCGGLHFDDKLFGWVLHTTGNDEADIDDPAVFAALKRLRRECVDAKEALSSETEVTIAVPLPPAASTVRFNRAEFEELIEPMVTETVDVLEAAIGAAGLEAADLSAVVLAGGAARTPLVKEMVIARLGRPVTVSPKPKLCVAMGAALIGEADLPSTRPAGAPVSRTRRSAELASTVEHQPRPSASSPSAEETVDTTERSRHANAGRPTSPPSRERKARPSGEPGESALTDRVGAQLRRLSWYRYATLALALVAVILALVGPVVPSGTRRYTWDQEFTVATGLPDQARITPKIWGYPVLGLDPVSVLGGKFSLSAYRYVLGGPVGADVRVGPAQVQAELAPAEFTTARFLNVGFVAMSLCLMFSFAYVMSMLQGLRRRKRSAALSEVLGLAWSGGVVGVAIVLAAWVLVGRRLDIGIAAVIVMVTSLSIALLGVGRNFALRE